jgi:hypothetical protein
LRRGCLIVLFFSKVLLVIGSLFILSVRLVWSGELSVFLEVLIPDWSLLGVLLDRGHSSRVVDCCSDWGDVGSYHWTMVDNCPDWGADTDHSAWRVVRSDWGDVSSDWRVVGDGGTSWVGSCGSSTVGGGCD